MQVPAYWPLVDGVQSLEKRGVLNEVKKVMTISAMDMVIEESDMPDMPDMESVAVEEGIDMVIDMDPVDVAVAIDMDVVIPVMSIDMDVVISLMSILEGAMMIVSAGVGGAPIRSAEMRKRNIRCDKPRQGMTPNICPEQVELAVTRKRA